MWEGSTVLDWILFGDQSAYTSTAFLFQHGSSQGKVINKRRKAVFSRNHIDVEFTFIVTLFIER